ncbi:MAG: hypothetical protein HRT88_13105, partial [Lentisphaeraceae bacterium]|nr:hypothetical protein [Lentisphaeraceae bacterium]
MDSTIDAEGNSTQTVYDGAGRVEKQIVNIDANPIAISPEDIVISKTYDLNGNVLTQTLHNSAAVASGDQLITSTYDALNRPVLVEDAENNVTETKYDLNGNASYVKNARGYETTSLFDEVNRPYRVTSDVVYDSETQQNTQAVVSTRYDANSNVIETIGARGLQTINEYDALNRLIKTTQVVEPNDTAKEVISI